MMSSLDLSPPKFPPSVYFHFLPLSLESLIFVLLLRDFLPRGSGIVTRRPLILQLNNAKAGEGVHAVTVASNCFTRQPYQ